MKISVIGTGNVGGALALQWANAGHEIFLGVRDRQNFKGSHLLENKNISVHSISKAGELSDVILIATAPQHIIDILRLLGNIEGKVVIDAMNSLRSSPEGFRNSFEAIRSIKPRVSLVKCFNSTGFENMRNPNYDGVGIDMFMAGSSENAKKVAAQLAIDAGFGECYDFGGDDKAELLEQFALSWINLAIMQGNGRNMAFKILKR